MDELNTNERREGMCTRGVPGERSASGLLILQSKRDKLRLQYRVCSFA